MGMYDVIICEQLLPGNPPDWVVKGDFQTKSLESLLETYSITTDGRLIRHCAEYEQVMDEDSFFGFYLRPIRKWEEVVAFHGDIVFYTSNFAARSAEGIYTFRAGTGDQLLEFEYRARFSDGNLQWIRENRDEWPPARPKWFNFGANSASLPATPDNQVTRTTPALTLKIFDYVPQLDCFVINPHYRQIADKLNLLEWDPVVWVGRYVMLDNDYGEHWFDNWELREQLEPEAARLGIPSEELFIINPSRFKNEVDGPCHTPELRKQFWRDVLKSLELSYELLFAEAREFNDRYQKYAPAFYISDLEERIACIRRDYCGQEVENNENL